MRASETKNITRRAGVILFFCTLAAFAFAESPNPLTSSGGPTTIAAPASVGIAALAPLLRNMTDRLAELAGEIRDAKTPGPMLALAFVSLLYGIFHALGPGHGKTIISTFFLAKDAKLKHSLTAGFLMALVHAISAITIVFVLFFIVQRVFSVGFESASKIVQTVSFGLVALIGAFLLIQKLRGGAHRHLFSFGPRESEDLRTGWETVKSKRGWRAGLERASGDVTVKELGGIALASGVVPCPGASAIILVCLSLNVMLAGVVAVAMISVGMGVTVSTIGAIAILAKRGVLKASAAKGSAGSGLARRIVEITGSVILFVFGLVLFIAQF
jgi:ABC-type nickel/cobalt efflux system permease component RcnA